MTVEILLRVVISALASYRLARMVAVEDGPFDLFSRWRGLVFGWHKHKKNWITDGVQCPLCVGFYISPLMLGLSYVDYVFYGVVALAVTGLQVALQKQERE